MTEKICPIFKHILESSNKPEEDIVADLSTLTIKITGQIFSAYLTPESTHKPTTTCLTNFFIRGASLAKDIGKYITNEDIVLDYGGGIGRISCHLIGKCQKIVSVDISQLASQYGSIIFPEIDFKEIEKLDESPFFSFALSTYVFFHLPFEEQKKVIDYIHKRLLPNGTFIICGIILRPIKEKLLNPGSNMYITNTQDFISYCIELFKIDFQKQVKGTEVIIMRKK